MTIRLLIVDDSAFMRKIISNAVMESTQIQVIGVARNGIDALESIERLKPDVITMDVEMPKLNGLEALKRIREKYNIPVIMLSSHSGSSITIEALELGAFDFIEKPGNLKSDLTYFKSDLITKITSAAKKEKIKHEEKSFNIKIKSIVTSCKIRAVAIGASTGGPRALSHIISRLPDRISVPIFIVQHMPKGFTTSLAERLDRESRISIVEAQHDMRIESNKVYLAPGDFHMTISGDRIVIDSNDKIHGVRPAADYLFNSASEKYGGGLLGVILTGMGKDGTEGMKVIKDNGGYNIAQDEQSCVIYGMPGNAVANGVIDEILSLEKISDKINELIRVK